MEQELLQRQSELRMNSFKNRDLLGPGPKIVKKYHSRYNVDNWSYIQDLVAKHVKNKYWNRASRVITQNPKVFD
jgi:hypothetical protein